MLITRKLPVASLFLRKSPISYNYEEINRKGKAFFPSLPKKQSGPSAPGYYYEWATGTREREGYEWATGTREREGRKSGPWNGPQEPGRGKAGRAVPGDGLLSDSSLSGK